MANSDQTTEHLEMALVKINHYTLAANDIDWCVSESNCLCLWKFWKIDLIILKGGHSVFVSQIGH
jgi:hypothetical protein